MGESSGFVLRVSHESPLVAVALHASHAIRSDLRELLALDETERLREEDPFTDRWTAIAPTRAIAERSRFEVDLNRPREQAVYLHPRDAWGLHVWHAPPPASVLAQSLALYDLFYATMKAILDEFVRLHGWFIVFDLHSYNHRRGGNDQPFSDPGDNPEVNVGTGSMDRQRWGGIVDRFLEELRRYDYRGRRLDVRENVRFRGGFFPRWIHETYPDSGCALAIEVKKFFMDEWTGEPDEEQLTAVQQALAATVPALLDD